jgi:hypothetical protein
MYKLNLSHQHQIYFHGHMVSILAMQDNSASSTHNPKYLGLRLSISDTEVLLSFTFLPPLAVTVLVASSAPSIIQRYWAEVQEMAISQIQIPQKGFV